MRSYRDSMTIEASAPIVWTVLADLSNPAPGAGIVERIEVRYERGVTIRTLHLAAALGGGSVTERIERLDPLERVLRYRVIDPGPVPMTHYVGEFRLHAMGEVTRVDYVAEFDASPEHIEAIASTAADHFRAYISNVAALLGN
jgi:hypothetical protein